MSLNARSKRRVWPIIAALTGLAVALPRVAGAQATPHLVVTRGEGAEDCPDANDLAGAVAKLAGRAAVDPSGSSRAKTRLYVDIKRDIVGLSAVIRAQGERSGERTIEDTGPGCANLARAVAIMLVIVVESLERGTAQSPNPLDGSKAPSDSIEKRADFRPELDSKSAPTPAFPSGQSLALSLPAVSAGGGVAFAALDGVSALAFADVEVWLGELISVGAGALFVLPTAASLGPGRVDLWLLSGSLRACANPIGDRAHFRIAVCAQAMLGALFGSAQGFTQNWSETLLWSALGGGLVAEGPIAGKLHWSARAIAFGVPGQLHFDVEGLNARYDVPRGGGFVSAGMGWVF